MTLLPVRRLMARAGSPGFRWVKSSQAAAQQLVRFARAR
jgi:hypothetical protein